MLIIEEYIHVYTHRDTQRCIMPTFLCENKINGNYEVYIRNNNILKNIKLAWRHCDSYSNWDVIDSFLKN